MDPTSKTSTKSARACDACYDAVFPLLDPAGTEGRDASISPSNSTLAGFPSWLSMPSFALSTQGSTPDALMSLDNPRRSLHPINDRGSEDATDDEDVVGTPTPRMRIKSSATRPRSYHQILEDFQDPHQRNSHPTININSSATHLGELDGNAVEETETITGSSSPEDPVVNQLSAPRKEDTARRHKRFSLPAIALQTTPVTALPNATGEGRSKRFSLVLGGRSNGQQAQSEQHDARMERGGSHLKDDLSVSVAAVKLGELLRRQKS